MVHNLKPGGAHRRLAAQVAAFPSPVREVVLSTATPVTASPVVVGVRPRAEAARKSLRPALRYTDLAATLAAWRSLGRLVRGMDPTAIWGNPCQLLVGAPPLGPQTAPIVYYCDEARRFDYDEGSLARTNPQTRVLYDALRRGTRAADRRAIATATAVVTNSRYSAGRIERAYGREAGVVPLGVGDEFFGSPDRPEPAHVLSVGSLIPTKGHDLVIAAVEEAGVDLPVVVVGPRPNAAEESRLRDLATERGVRLDVRVGVTDDELRDLYTRALATLYLAREEPFGLVSLEAQAGGCPVIVAAEGGLPETVEDGVTGWSVPRTAAAAADRLRLLADPALRARVSVAAVQRARLWSWSASAEAMEAELVSAASRRSLVAA